MRIVAVADTHTFQDDLRAIPKGTCSSTPEICVEVGDWTNSASLRHGCGPHRTAQARHRRES